MRKELNDTEWNEIKKMFWIEAMVIHFINTPPSNPSQTNQLDKTLTLKKKEKKVWLLLIRQKQEI